MLLWLGKCNLPVQMTFTYIMIYPELNSICLSSKIKLLYKIYNPASILFEFTLRSSIEIVLSRRQLLSVLLSPSISANAI